jgi:hypothetical protein
MNIEKLSPEEIWDLFINMDVKEFLIHSPRHMTVYEICEDFVDEFDEVIPIEISDDEARLILCAILDVIIKSGLVTDFHKPYKTKVKIRRRKNL